MERRLPRGLSGFGIRNRTDTDSASDWRVDYVLDYNASRGYLGLKDYGQ